MMRAITAGLATYAAYLAVALPCSGLNGSVWGQEGRAQPKEPDVNLRLTLRDAETGALVPGRITVEQRPVGGESVYHVVKSLDPAGSAVTYDVARSETSFEKHTTVSAHPFGASVPPGMYVVYYEHGPEWRGNKAILEVKKGEVTEHELTITRWIDMNERGWYSGDTHVHRSLDELPNVMRTEDLNVALPLSYWVRDAYTPPSKGDKTVAVEPGLITVDPARVIWPMNTEYELFTVNGRRHTLGAVFVLNHHKPLTLPAPPVAPIAAEARRQGALLDLDKHSWPWSMMLVPIMDVDLFELSNNHIWRTEFFFKQWTQEFRPDGWNIETDADGFTEWGWIDFGFKTYYALLNCGFRLRPTAGTASGVHPVPLGFGRVYVECPGEFSYGKWMEGLDAGRSFVSTGPMLFVTVNDQPPGGILVMEEPGAVHVSGRIENYGPLHRIEIIRNGSVVDVIQPDAAYDSPNVWRASFNAEVPVDRTSWIAVRCFADRTDDPTAFRFAHSSPVHVEVPGKPLQPRKVETGYFVRRMEDELARNRDALAADELAEYERALEIYRQLDATAIEDAPITDADLLSMVIPEEDLPEGWDRPPLDETPLQLLPTNPAIVSHPVMVDELTEHMLRDSESLPSVTRMMLALYSAGRTNEGDRGVVQYVFVCPDEAAAASIAELLRQREPVRRGRVLQRGTLAIAMAAFDRGHEADLDTLAPLVEQRLPPE